VTTSKAGSVDGLRQSSLTTHATALGKVLLANNPYVGLLNQKRNWGHSRTRRSPITRGWSVSSRWCVSGLGSEVGKLSRPSLSIAAPIVDRRDAAVRAIAIFGRPERLPNAGKLRGNLLGYVRESARRVQGARGDPLVILGERAKDQSRDTAAAEQP
jgi:DNA-binding IclR family transcriptional regulator